jgi:hypothetical protein
MRNTSDLGEQALVGTGQLDAVNECFVDSLRAEGADRSAAGQAAVERLDKVVAHSAALGQAIEAGRERVLGALSTGADSAQRQAELEAACRRQLDDCAAFVSQAAITAAQARDGIRRRLRADAAELARVGAGIDSARNEIKGALAHGFKANEKIKFTEKHLEVLSHIDVQYTNTDRKDNNSA